jgi:hypothetical protein
MEEFGVNFFRFLALILPPEFANKTSLRIFLFKQTFDLFGITLLFSSNVKGDFLVLPRVSPILVRIESLRTVSRVAFLFLDVKVLPKKKRP